MAIKSYTDINQSRKLAEILPLESADMHYCLENRDVVTGYEISIVPFIKARRFKGECNIVDIQPAWSLAALLRVLPDHFYDETGRMTLGMDKGDTYYHVFYENNNSYIQKSASNPIDACVAMIEKLNELKML